MAEPPTISLSTSGSDPKVTTKEELESQVNGAFVYAYNDLVQKGDLITVSQAEAEAGVAITRRAWTAERVRQAIVAWINANLLTKFSTLGYGLASRYPENGDVLTAIDGDSGNSMFKFSYGNLKTKLGLDEAFAPWAEIQNRTAADEALSGDIAAEAATRLAADNAFEEDYTAALDARVGADGAPVDFANPWYFKGEKVVSAMVDTSGRASFVQTEEASHLGDMLNLREDGDFYLSGKRIVQTLGDSSDRLWVAMLEDGSTVIPGLVAGAGPEIDCFGDSLTEGAGGGGTTYPIALQSILGTPVYGRGIGAQTSTQISMRQGGNVARVTISADQIVSGANVITEIDGVVLSSSGGMAANKNHPFPLSSQSGNLERREIVTIQGVKGVLRRTASGGVPSTVETYTFTPLGGQYLPVTCPPQSPMRFTARLGEDHIQILWLGRNDNQSPDQIKSNVAHCVNRLRDTGGRYLILSVLNGAYGDEGAGNAAYDVIVGVNNDLEELYPRNFVDIRRLLISEGLARAGITPTAQDETDIANDIPPSSLRNDNIHLNAAGYTVVAEILAEQLRSRGWLN